MKLNQDEIKRAVGEKAASFIEDGMLVGLGTGSTASYFIESLIKRCRAGLKITAVSSSIKSLEMAKKGGINVIDMDDITSIDLTVDGADEVDPSNRMIKGGGGAHVREKIVASTSKKMIVIVDEGKLVPVLGRFGLPVEILPFGFRATISKLEKIGYLGKPRKKKDQDSLYVTDNGNYIFDIHTPQQFLDPMKDHVSILNVPGVIDTGFFLNMPVEILVGHADGTVSFRTKIKKKQPSSLAENM